MREHQASCPRAQMWDHGEWDVACTCAEEVVTHVERVTSMTVMSSKDVPPIDIDSYPRVTEIIRAAGLMGDGPSYWTEEHRNRGTAVHEAIGLYLRDDLDWSSIEGDEKLCGRVKSFAAWREATGALWSFIEIGVFDPELRYRGTADLVDTKRTVFDIKSPYPAPWHGVQLAAYQGPVKAERRANLYLQNDGSPAKLVWREDPEDWEIFKAALKLWHWRNR